MAAVVLTAALLLPMTPHTGAELAAWESDWLALPRHGEPEREELADMVSRHLWYFFPQPEEVIASARHNVGSVATPPPTLLPSAWPGDWVALVAAYFRPEDVEAALRVIRCESGFSLLAKNPTSSAWGPWQFLRSTWDNMVAPNTGSPSYDSGAPTDPVWSTVNAAWLWYNVGPNQWVCF